MSGSSPVLPETTLSLSVPTEGLHARGVVLRFAELDDVDGILPAFTDAELREAGNLPAFNREQLLASLGELPALAERGRLLALAAADAESGEIIGGATLHHLDSERKIVEIGYFVLPAARGRGVATTIARTLAEHAFTLGIERVAAYVKRRQHGFRAGAGESRVHPRGRRPIHAQA